MNAATLAAFVFSYILIAVSPGLCMSLSLTLGIRIGVQRTLWMMGGELAGVALVGIASMAGVTALMLNYPGIFTVAKWTAAAYLLWTAVKAWNAATDVGVGNSSASLTRRQLIMQGFVTATSNPKAWIFFAALFPAFIDPARAILPQAAILLPIMLVIEFGSLLLYASGGRALQLLLTRRGLGHWLNRISAVLMTGIAVWLVLPARFCLSCSLQWAC